MQPKPLEAGDTIRLKREVAKTQVCPKGRENHQTAKIRCFTGADGGILTDRDLRGCLYWNIDDVEKVEDNT